MRYCTMIGCVLCATLRYDINDKNRHNMKSHKKSKKGRKGSFCHQMVIWYNTMIRRQRQQSEYNEIGYIKVKK